MYKWHHRCHHRRRQGNALSMCWTLTGGTLAPVPVSGGHTYLCPVDPVAMVPREPQIPAD